MLGTHIWAPSSCFVEMSVCMCRMSVLAAEMQKRGGIPPRWLHHQPSHKSVEATDGHGLGLLGNWQSNTLIRIDSGI